VGLHLSGTGLYDYLARVLHDVRENWYRFIPDPERAPQMKKGKVSVLLRGLHSLEMIPGSAHIPAKGPFSCTPKTCRVHRNLTGERFHSVYSVYTVTF
jgi:hypothetical protein